MTCAFAVGNQTSVHLLHGMRFDPVRQHRSHTCSLFGCLCPIHSFHFSLPAGPTVEMRAYLLRPLPRPAPLRPPCCCPLAPLPGPWAPLRGSLWLLLGSKSPHSSLPDAVGMAPGWSHPSLAVTFELRPAAGWEAIGAGIEGTFAKDLFGPLGACACADTPSIVNWIIDAKSMDSGLSPTPVQLSRCQWPLHQQPGHQRGW